MCKRRQHIRSVFVKKYEKYDFKFDSAVLICGLLIIADRIFYKILPTLCDKSSRKGRKIGSG